MVETSPKTPPSTSLPIRGHEADTITKNRFYHAIDHRLKAISIKHVCEEENIAHDTGKKWLKQRNRLGAAALRRTDRIKSEKFKKVSFDVMNQMLNSQQNLVRRQPWLAQIEHFDLSVSQRTLQRAMHERFSRVDRYKMTRIRSISNRNKKLRVRYARKHQNHTVKNFFQYVHWSDKAHFDFDQTYDDFILRKKGMQLTIIIFV